MLVEGIDVVNIINYFAYRCAISKSTYKWTESKKKCKDTDNSSTIVLLLSVVRRWRTYDENENKKIFTDSQHKRHVAPETPVNPNCFTSEIVNTAVVK